MGGAVFRDERVRRRFPADFYAQGFTELAEYTRNFVKTG
jgi:hypothetical protein